MSTFLPLFPLNIVVYPGEKLRLYIFEERYKQLIRECLEGSTTFGIPTVIDKQVLEIATEMKVISMDKKFPGGEMNITTRGMSRVFIEKFDKKAANKLYPGGDVRSLDSDESTDILLQEEIFSLLSRLNEALDISKKVVSFPAEIRAFSVGHHIGLNLKQEYHLNTLNLEKDRLIYIRSHLQRVLPVVQETARMKAKARLNGHYKSLIPPEF